MQSFFLKNIFYISQSFTLNHPSVFSCWFYHLIIIQNNHESNSFKQRYIDLCGPYILNYIYTAVVIILKVKCTHGDRYSANTQKNYNKNKSWLIFKDLRKQKQHINCEPHFWNSRMDLAERFSSGVLGRCRRRGVISWEMSGIRSRRISRQRLWWMSLTLATMLTPCNKVALVPNDVQL